MIGKKELCLSGNIYIQSSYIILFCYRVTYQVFPHITAAEEISDTDSDSDIDTKKKRYRKEKIGFRDRKVSQKMFITPKIYKR